MQIVSWAQLQHLIAMPAQYLLVQNTLTLFFFIGWGGGDEDGRYSFRDGSKVFFSPLCDHLSVKPRSILNTKNESNESF